MNNTNKKRADYIKKRFGVKRFFDEFATPSFLEVSFRMGTNIVTLRVYGDNEDNFMITER